MKFLQQLVIVGAIAALFFSTGKAQAQSTVDLALSATYKFGEQITFTAQTRSPLQIVSVSIEIYDNSRGITYSEPVSFSPEGLSVFLFDTRQKALRLRAGAHAVRPAARELPARAAEAGPHGE